MNVPDLIFENLSLLASKYLNSSMWIRIWDLFNPRSEMEKIGSGINIPNPQHGKK
jgi:hypothetical protein